ncbi:maleate cis-trans isomerase family protein [Actinomycetospora sp. CA-053990]|uniref:maleate cis-trans isomerase family protein n=1 Tax=Actinomycetospora sp. CA-053990 TaxID=3239891 RepID=UPI003D90F86C
MSTATPAPSTTTVDYGDRLRLGIVLPSGNTVAEPEIAAMLPPGVVAHVTRLPLVGSSPEALARMADGVDAAAELLADAHPDLVLFHCTAVTTIAPELEERLRTTMERRTGVPAVTTGAALVAALRALAATRVGLLTPYVPAVHDREKAFLAEHGVEVVVDAALGLDTNTEMARVPPPDLVDFVARHAHPEAEAYLLSCTALRSAPTIEVLEQLTGRPVVTSNQAAVWHALRRAGVGDVVPRFGRLLTG